MTSTSAQGCTFVETLTGSVTITLDDPSSATGTAEVKEQHTITAGNCGNLGGGANDEARVHLLSAYASGPSRQADLHTEPTSPRQSAASSGGGADRQPQATRPRGALRGDIRNHVELVGDQAVVDR